jgi:micrococcal nuclease
MIAPNYSYRARVRSVYDGDTIRVDVDLGFGIWAQDTALRLLGLNAPEVRGSEREAGLAVRDALLRRIPVGSEIMIVTKKDKTEKYGRMLATLWHDGENLNDWLLAEGHAVPYAA